MSAFAHGILARMGSKWDVRGALSRPENIVTFIIMVGFLSNVQRDVDRSALLRSDPLALKAIRLASVLAAGVIAISCVWRRKLSYRVYFGFLLPLALYLCFCLLSSPFSVYPLLSLFKTSEIGLLLLICAIGITSEASRPADLFNWGIKIVYALNIVIWCESILFPGLA